MTLYETYGEAVLADHVGPSEFEDMPEEDRLDALHELLRETTAHELRAHGTPGDFEQGYTMAGDKADSETGQKVEGGFKTRPHVLLTSGRGSSAGIDGMIRYPVPADKTAKKKSHPQIYQGSVHGKEAHAYCRVGKYRVALMRLTTITPHKIAMDNAGDRYMLLPECSLERMLKFVQIVKKMHRSVDLLKLRMKKSGTWALDCADGTYPSAVPRWAFGSLAFTSVISDKKAEYPWVGKIDRVRVVGTGTASRTEPVPKHLLSLKSAKLRPVFQDAAQVAKGMDDKREELFLNSLQKWMLRFDGPSLQHFLRDSARNTFPRTFTTLFDHYFTMDIPTPVVESAKAAGQHVSNQAYNDAKSPDLSKDQIEQEKAKTIAATESLLYDAESISEMIGRLTSTIGRLEGRAFPGEANLFFDKALAGEISMAQARQLLIVYMRTIPENAGSEKGGSEENGESSSPESSGESQTSAQEPAQTTTTDTSDPVINIDDS